MYLNFIFQTSLFDPEKIRFEEKFVILEYFIDPLAIGSLYFDCENYISGFEFIH